jgi:hypothetical protein
MSRPSHPPRLKGTEGNCVCVSSLECGMYSASAEATLTDSPGTELSICCTCIQPCRVHTTVAARMRRATFTHLFPLRDRYWSTNRHGGFTLAPGGVGDASRRRNVWLLQATGMLSLLQRININLRTGSRCLLAVSADGGVWLSSARQYRRYGFCTAG